MDAKTFGAFIASCRRERDMTQADLAVKLNVTDKAVSRWERGIGFPDISTISPLASALEMSVLEIMKSEKATESKGCGFCIPLSYFDPHVVYLTGNAMAKIPVAMWEHIHNGGKVWLVKEPEDDKALVSISKNPDDVNAVIDASDLITKVRNKPSIAECMPEPFASHIRNGGRLYVIGWVKDGKICVSTSMQPGGYSVMVPCYRVQDEIGTDFAEISKILYECVQIIKSDKPDDERISAGLRMRDYLIYCTTIKELDDLTAEYRDTSCDLIIGYDPPSTLKFVSRMLAKYRKTDEGRTEE